MSITPSDVSGLQLWLDAKKYSSLTFDSSGNVFQWNDQSGYGRNATKHGNIATRVGYNATGFNNLPAIQYSIAGQGISSAMPAGTFSNGVTMFVIFQSTGAVGGYSFGGALICRDLTNQVPAPFIIYNGGSRWVGNGTNYNSSNYSTFSTLSTGMNLFCSTCASSGIWNEYINGSYVYTSSSTPYYADIATAVYIGTRRDNAVSFVGTMSEILIYNSVLSTNNRQIVEGYLAWKWNLVSSTLSKNHPYYTHAPLSFIPSWNIYPYKSNAFIQTYIKDFVDISGNLVVRNQNVNVLNGDISFNSNMYLQTSFNANSIITTGNIIATNNFLLTGTGYAQINGNVFLGNTITKNLLTNNLVGNSNTINGNLYIRGSLYILTGNIYLNSLAYPFIHGLNTNNISFGGLNKPLLVNTTNTVTISGYLAGNSLINSTNPNILLIGSNALQYHNTDTTVAIGYNTLNIYGNSTTNGGNFLIAIGANAGSIILDTSAVGVIKTGEYNTFIGANTGIDSSVNSWSRSTAIGAGAIITANNQVVLGTSAGIIYVPGKLLIASSVNSNYFYVTGNAFFTGDICANNYYLTTLNTTYGAIRTASGDLTYMTGMLGSGFSHCAEYIGAFSANSYFAIDCSFSTNTADPSNVLYIPNNAILNSVYIQSKTNVTTNTTINVTKNNNVGTQISTIISSGQNKGNNISSSITFISGDFLNVNFGASGGGGSIYRVSMLFNYYNYSNVPFNVYAFAGNTIATVNWTVSNLNVNYSITGYRVTQYPGGNIINGNSSIRTASFTGLTNGTSYYFGVFAINSTGNSDTAFSNNIIPSTFFPSNITGLRLWIDANDRNCYTLATGTNISQLRDKSGSGNNTTLFYGLQPTILNNSINSLPTFNMINGGFQGPISPTNTGATLTFFMIISFSTFNTAGQIIGLGNADETHSDLANALKCGMHTNNGFFPSLYRNNVFVNSSTLNINTPYLMSVYFNGTNGFLGINGTYNSFATSGNFSISKYGIGMPTNITTSGYGFYRYGEILIYSNLLSTTNIQRTEGYLAWKWGINSSLPTNHPYYNTNPFI